MEERRQRERQNELEEQQQNELEERRQREQENELKECRRREQQNIDEVEQENKKGRRVSEQWGADHFESRRRVALMQSDTESDARIADQISSAAITKDSSNPA